MAFSVLSVRLVLNHSSATVGRGYADWGVFKLGPVEVGWQDKRPAR